VGLTRTALGSWVSGPGHGAASFQTGSFTPPANSLLIVAVAMMGDGTSGNLGQPTISGGGLTYTFRGHARGDAFWSNRVNVFTAPVGGSPSSMTITVDDDNNQSIYNYAMVVLAYEGQDGTTPIAGWVDSGTVDIADGSHTLTLTATPTVDDESIIILSSDTEFSPAAPTPATDWTTLYDLAVASDGATLSVMTRPSSTSTSATVTDVYTAGGNFYKGSMMAFIVKAAPLVLQVMPSAATVKASRVNPSVAMVLEMSPLTATVKAVIVSPSVLLALILSPNLASVRVLTAGPIVIGGGGVNPLGEGDSPGFIVFALASAMHATFELAGLDVGLDAPDENNAGDWETFLFG